MLKMKRKHLLLGILLLTMTMLLMQLVRANPISAVITPEQGPVGTSVTISGIADTPEGTINIYYDTDGDGQTEPGELQTSTTAGPNPLRIYSATITVPASTAGTHAITANDVSSGNSIGTSFTVTSAITVIPETGPIGTLVTVIGTGFDSNSAVTITIEPSLDVIPPTPQTDEFGSFSTSFTMPPALAGVYVMIASEASNVASDTFTLSGITVAIDPMSGPVGTVVAVSGTRATLGGSVAISWDSIERAAVLAGQDGTYAYDLTILASKVGAHEIKVEDLASQNTAAMTFTVEPKVVLSVEEGPVDTEVTVAGTGFAAEAFVDITYDSSLQVDDFATDSTGGFAATFNVPPSVAGIHMVTATDTSDATVTAEATFAVIPAITLSAVEGPIGAEVTVTGTGFAGISSITFTFGGIDVTPGSEPATDEAGSFSASFLVPPIPTGTHMVSVADEDANTAAIDFTVWDITISINPTAGIVGTLVSVSGTYATPNGALTIKWDGATLWTTQAANDGTYTYDLTVPASTFGQHTITMIDDQSTNSATSTFTTEPKITLDPEDGLVGDPVTVAGTGFSGGSTVDVYFDKDQDGLRDPEDLMSADVSIDETGSFSITFNVPWVQKSGNYLITAIDQETVTDDATFTVLFVAYTQSGEYLQGDYPSFFIDAAMITGDPMNNAEVLVNVYDSVGNLQYKGITVTIEDGTVPYDMQFFNYWMVIQMDVLELTPLHLPSDAALGTWTWTAATYGLTVDGSFQVLEPVDLRTLLGKLDQLLEGQDDAADLIVYYGEKLQLDHVGMADLINAVSNKLQLNQAELVNLINQVAQQLQLDHDDIIQMITSLTGDLQLRLDNLSALLTQVSDKLQLNHQELITLIGDVSNELKLDHQTLATLVNNVFDALEIKLDDIKTDINGVIEKVDGLYLVIGNLDVKLEDINAKVVDIQAGMATISTTLGGIQVKLTDVQAQLVEIKDSMATVGTVLGQIDVKLDDIQAKLIGIEGTLATVTTDIGTVKADISDIGGKLTSVEGRLATIETDIGSIQVDLANVKGEITSINGRLVDITTAIGTIQTDIGAVNGRLTSIEGSTATITTDLGIIKTDVGNINGKVVDIQDRMATIETDIGEVKTDLTDLQARLIEITGTLATVDTALGRVETKVDNVGAVSLEEIKDNVATIMTDIGTIKTTVSTINANITSIKGKLVTIETTVGTIDVDIENIHGKIVLIQDDTATIQTDIGKAKTDMADINSKIKVTNDNVATIQTDVGTIKGKLTSVEGDVATIETEMGTMQTSTKNIETTSGSIKSDTTWQTPAVALSLIAAVAAIAAAVMVLRKVYMK